MEDLYEYHSDRISFKRLHDEEGGRTYSLCLRKKDAEWFEENAKILMMLVNSVKPKKLKAVHHHVFLMGLLCAFGLLQENELAQGEVPASKMDWVHLMEFLGHVFLNGHQCLPRMDKSNKVDVAMRCVAVMKMIIEVKRAMQNSSDEFVVMSDKIGLHALPEGLTENDVRIVYLGGPHLASVENEDETAH